MTIDYLLVLLHITPSFVWFMQAQVETQVLFVPDGGLSLARKIPPHQNQSNAFTPLRLRFTQQQSLPKSAVLPLVGPARRCRVNFHSEVAPFSCTWSRLRWRPKCLPPRGSVAALKLHPNKHLPLSTSQPNLPSDRMSSAIIVPSIGVSPWVLVPSTARATLRDHHWLVQRPLEGLFAIRACRCSACGLSLPHFLRFYANIVDLLLGSGSTAWTAPISQAGQRSHLTGRVLEFG